MDEMLRKQLETIDKNGDGVIDGDEIMNYAKNFAEQQLELAEESTRRENAEKETKAANMRLKYALVALLAMVAMFCTSTAVNLIGTNKVVKKYHFSEAHDGKLTDTDGETLQCASAARFAASLF